MLQSLPFLSAVAIAILETLAHQRVFILAQRPHPQRGIDRAAAGADADQRVAARRLRDSARNNLIRSAPCRLQAAEKVLPVRPGFRWINLCCTVSRADPGAIDQRGLAPYTARHVSA